MSDIEVWMSTPELDALAVTINEEYRLANGAAETAVEHAIACGEALTHARANVVDGQWVKWLNANVDVSARLAHQWIRLAIHKELVRSARSVEGAARQLRELNVPRIDSGRGDGQQPSFDVREAKALRRQGWTYHRIGDAMGVSGGVVRIHLDPVAREKSKNYVLEKAKRRRSERRQLQRLQRDNAVKNVGGDISVVYSWLRKAAVMVDQAIVDSDDVDYRVALRSVQSGLTRAESAIVKALKIK